MHIFITGIAGFLGSNLADFYIKKNFKVSGCDNLVGGDREFVNPKAIFYQGDCEDLDFMTRSTKGVDVICHAAAFAHEGLSSISPTLVCNNNVTGSVSVFTSGIRNKVKRILNHTKSYQRLAKYHIQSLANSYVYLSQSQRLRVQIPPESI